MQQTKIGTLIWIAIGAIPVGWTISRVVDATTNALPPIPWVLPVLLVFLAVILEFAGRAVRAWIAERRYDEQIDAFRVARLTVLAKATAVFGAALAGAYLGLMILALDSWLVPMGRNRVWLSAFVIAAAIAASIAALRCEQACRAPTPDE